MTYSCIYSDIYISFNPPSDVVLGIRRATIYIFPLLAAAMILFRTHFDGGTLDTSDLGQHNRHSQKGRLFKPWVSALCGKPTGPVLKFSRFNKLSYIIHISANCIFALHLKAFLTISKNYHKKTPEKKNIPSSKTSIIFLCQSYFLFTSRHETYLEKSIGFAQ